MFDYYIDAFKHYADFSGRTGRKAFWYFVLWNFIISLILSWISRDLANLYSLIVFIPSLAIGVRRLHDIGKSGWWILLGFIPIVGWIWLIILFAQKGIHEGYSHSTHHRESHHNSGEGRKEHKEKR